MTPGQVMFSWEPPREDLQNGVITQYNVTCVDSMGRREAVVDVITANDPRTFNLAPATQYECLIEAGTFRGFGSAEMIMVLTGKQSHD